MYKQGRTYIQICKDIFRYASNADRVRLDSLKSWLVVSSMMSAIFCVPASIIIGIMWLTDPKEDSVLLLMAIPWIFICPLVFLAAYIVNYRKPRKNDRIIEELFSLVQKDIPITLEDGFVYMFRKDGFLFKVYFETRLYDDPRKKAGKKIKARTINMLMYFGFSGMDISEYPNVVDEVKAYLDGKRMGQSIWVNYCLAGINMDYGRVAAADVTEIVDEFIYLTGRFGLTSLDEKGYGSESARIKSYFSARS